MAVYARLTSHGYRSWSAIPLRLIVGYGFMEHGYAKIARGPEKYASILHALGVPAPDFLAWVTILVELFGGLAVFLGFFILLASIPMAIVLLVAIFTVHLPNGFSSIKLLSVDAAGRISGNPALRRRCSIWLRSLPWSLAVLVRWRWTDFCCREDANDTIHVGSFEFLGPRRSALRRKRFPIAASVRIVVLSAGVKT